MVYPPLDSTCPGQSAIMLYFPYMPTAAQEANVTLEIAQQVVRFPLWWYTTGTMYTLQRLSKSVQYASRLLAFGVWVRNLFVPMYGLYDWKSRVMSFIVRSAQIVFRGIALLVWIVLCFAQLIIYLALPGVAVIMVGYFLYVAAV